MHEFSLAQAISDAAFEKASGRSIAVVTLDIGAFSGVSSDSLLFYLEILLEEKQVPKPRIDAKCTAASCVCECGTRYEAERYLDPCPDCGGYKRKVEKGQDCLIESIEVSDG